MISKFNCLFVLCWWTIILMCFGMNIDYCNRIAWISLRIYICHEICSPLKITLWFSHGLNIRHRRMSDNKDEALHNCIYFYAFEPTACKRVGDRYVLGGMYRYHFWSWRLSVFFLFLFSVFCCIWSFEIINCGSPTRSRRWQSIWITISVTRKNGIGDPFRLCST